MQTVYISWVESLPTCHWQDWVRLKATYRQSVCFICKPSPSSGWAGPQLVWVGLQLFGDKLPPARWPVQSSGEGVAHWQLLTIGSQQQNNLMQPLGAHRLFLIARRLLPYFHSTVNDALDILSSVRQTLQVNVSRKYIFANWAVFGQRNRTAPTPLL